MNDRDPVNLSYGTARLWKQTSDRVARLPRPGPPAAPGGAAWTYGIVRARVTTAVPTGTWDAPSSSGRAQVRHKNELGAWVDSGDPVVVWNDNTMPSSIPVGRVIKLSWIDGEWWLVSGSCS